MPDEPKGPEEPTSPVIGEAMKGLDALRDSPIFRQSAERTEAMRQMAASLREPPTLLRHFPSEEAAATHAVREEIANLAEITATNVEQTTALREIAEDLSPALREYAKSAGRTAWVLVGLTVVLVFLTLAIALLTAVLVFGGSGPGIEAPSLYPSVRP